DGIRDFHVTGVQTCALPISWSVLLLFGGGLSLASAIESSGLAAWIGVLLEACAGWPVVAVVLLITALVVFLTEVTSNTATASVRSEERRVGREGRSRCQGWL